ncbi:hypothetical protein NL676_036212 [Syzygium grande]|nr:hypothetical protein NL676_036212 [Syzygium grande]
MLHNIINEKASATVQRTTFASIKPRIAPKLCQYLAPENGNARIYNASSFCLDFDDHLGRARSGPAGAPATFWRAATPTTAPWGPTPMATERCKSAHRFAKECGGPISAAFYMQDFGVDDRFISCCQAIGSIKEDCTTSYLNGLTYRCSHVIYGR